MPRRDPFAAAEGTLVAGMVIAVLIGVIMGIRELWRWLTGV